MKKYAVYTTCIATALFAFTLPATCAVVPFLLYFWACDFAIEPDQLSSAVALIVFGNVIGVIGILIVLASLEYISEFLDKLK